MPSSSGPRLALAPENSPGWMADAIEAVGGRLVPVSGAEGWVWGTRARPAELVATLDTAPDVRWVQLPYAGVERFLDVIDDDRTWTCGKGVYAEPVAELAVGFALALMRGIQFYSGATTWLAPRGRNVLDGRVTILGGGGIPESLARLLTPFRSHVTVVRNRVQAMDGADVVIESERLYEALSGAHLVVVALPLTAETEGIIGADELRLMERDAFLINVARGKHVVTGDLVDALREGTIAGAALDVTDPEPLPEGHPLWALSNCIITPHVGNTPEMAEPLLAERITANVRRFAAGAPLPGLVDTDLGY